MFSLPSARPEEMTPEHQDFLIRKVTNFYPSMDHFAYVDCFYRNLYRFKVGSSFL